METAVAMPEAPARYRVTVEQYHRMGETGIIPHDVRVELVDGEIVAMSAMGSRHAATVGRLNRAFNPLWDLTVPRCQCQGGFPFVVFCVHVSIMFK